MSDKYCKSCDRYLPATNEFFAVHKHMNDGWSSTCKSCKKAYDREYRLKNKEKMKAKQKEYFQKNKEKRLAYHKTWREENQEHLEKYRKVNKDRTTEFNKKYWAENKEQVKKKIAKWRKENKERIRQYRKENRERDRLQQKKWTQSDRGNKLSRLKTNAYRARKRKLPNDFTPQQWEECIQHFDNGCAYCGEKSELLEQEHFIPVSKGGAFTKNNIVIACRTCNASKTDRDFFEWYPEQPYYSQSREMKILQYLKVGEVRNGEGIPISVHR